MSDFKNLVKISIKNKTVFHSAMEYFFSKTDRTSGYLAEQSVKYDIYSKLKKKYSKYVGKTNFKQYPGDESEKVWVCWFQGIENAPEIVQNCIKSLKYHIKDREIVFLNDDLANDLKRYEIIENFSDDHDFKVITNILINLSFTWAMSWISLSRQYFGIELELQKMVLKKQAVTQIHLIFKGIENWDIAKA